MSFEVSPPDQVLWIWRTLEEAGFETWIVGGAIRDIMLGGPAGDWDFATKAHPKEVMAVFRRTVPIGVDHGTVGVLGPDGTLYEVTTFRRDVQTFGRRAVVEFAEGIEEDLSRRDFTVNAIAWHPGREQLLDPWGGAADLNDQVLRTVGEPAERFAEDLLRVLRALRFAGQFSLTIDPPTWRALLEAVPELSQLSPERIQEEMMKVLSQAPKPSVALGLYAASGVFGELFSEIRVEDPEIGVEGFHPTLSACDHVPPTRPLVRLAVLFARVGTTRSGTTTQERTSSEDRTSPVPNEGASESRRRAIEGLMKRLRFSNADTKRVAAVSARVSPAPSTESRAVLRRWLNRVGPEHFRDIARVWLAHARASEESGSVPLSEDQEAVIHRIRALKAVLRMKPPLEIGDLALDGSDLKKLGLPPGPRFGEILQYLLEEVLDRPELNNRADLEALAERGGFLGDGSPTSSTGPIE